jgi:methionine-rich copper-binding protein CopC
LLAAADDVDRGSRAADGKPYMASLVGVMARKHTMTTPTRPFGRLRRSARCRLALFGLLLALLPLASARAHAIIVASKPVVNASLPQGPLAIELTFNSRVDLSLSRLDLVGPDGHGQRLAIAPDSPPGAMVAHAGTNAPGQWKLRWLALSTDGHITRGEIPFVVTGKTTP